MYLTYSWVLIYNKISNQTIKSIDLIWFIVFLVFCFTPTKTNLKVSQKHAPWFKSNSTGQKPTLKCNLEENTYSNETLVIYIYI